MWTCAILYTRAQYFTPLLRVCWERQQNLDKSPKSQHATSKCMNSNHCQGGRTQLFTPDKPGRFTFPWFFGAVIQYGIARDLS